MRKQKVLQAVDYEKIDTNFRNVLPFYYDYLVQKQTPEQLSKNPAYETLVEKYFQNDTWKNIHHYTFFQNLNDVDVLTAYKEVDCPVLSLSGELDLNTANTDWAKEITDVVNFYHPGNGNYLILPQTTHYYHTVPSMDIYLQLWEEGKINEEYYSQYFNSDIAVIVQEWIEKIDLAKRG